MLLNVISSGETMNKSRGGNRTRRWIAWLLSVVLLSVGITMLPVTAAADDMPTPPPFLQRDDNVVTADPLPTVQIDNGYVWSQATIGTTVYAVGQFDNARAPLAPPGTNLTPRSNVLAYDITTGDLLPFAPTVNGVVKAVAASPDGSRVYIGGSFNNVNGASRWNFAALDASTGQLVSGFTPSIGGSGVYAITVSGSSVYVGGLFTQANGTARKNLASFSAENGALLPWAPQTDLQVDAMVMDPAGQKIIAAGRFSQVNGNTAMRGAAAIDKVTGEVDADWALPETVKNGWNSGFNAGKAGIFALATDENAVYGTGWVFANASVGNLEGTFAAEADTGEVRWISDCLGDHYGVYSTGTVVYTTSHTHACSTQDMHPEQQPRTHRYAEAYTVDARGLLGKNPHAGTTYQNWEGTPGPSAYAWSPDWAVGLTTGMGQAGLSITGAGNTISIAGEFRSVNNGRFEGIVRFSTTPPGGAQDGPRLAEENWVPTAVSLIPGRVRVTIPANWDRDDLNLTYELQREGTATPVATRLMPSKWWDRSALMLEDTTATPGVEYTYTVVARDGDGNTATSQAVNVTAHDGVAAGYVDAVLDDDPDLYYPLGDTPQDWAGANAPIFSSNVTAGTPGIAQSSTGYSNFSGTTNSTVRSTTATPAPTEFSTELWFRTDTTRGGKLIGYGSSATGNSTSYDRHLYMRTDGRLVFGVYPGAARTIQSPLAYNDNQWHHVVASQSSAGIQLFVDGELVDSDAAWSSAQDYLGYWQIGGDNLSGWPNRPTSDYFSGSIDEVAVYSSALNPTQVRTHYGIGSGFEAPTAAFSSTTNGLEVAFDASDSVAAGTATISEYEWDFGDGSPAGTGVMASHSYVANGTYTVVLTVTDSNGLSSTTQQDVAVLGSNVLPTAEFTVTTAGLTASFDGTPSVDPDGMLISYEWNWGDGETSLGGAMESHTYAAAGTYAVTLTVTDDRGGPASVSHDVVVTHADPVAQFTASNSGLTVNVDGSASTAFDGASLDHAWDWGDGTPDGTGVTASHIYAADGDYEITLTVTDSFGSSHSVSRTVTVTAQAFAASDAFDRVLASGWGAADTGGVWAPNGGSAAAASVGDGVGRINLNPGETREMVLQGTSVTDSLSKVSYVTGSGPDAGVVYVGLGARHSSAGNYRALGWHRADGTVWLVIQRNGSAVAATPVSGLTWSEGKAFHLASEVAGSSPTTIKATVWADGSSEPATWQVQTTDSTAALQTAGMATVFYYRAGSTSGAARAAFDNFTLRDSAGPDVNVPPVASFTVAAEGLSVSVDGSDSLDPDGSIASYAWEFGDDTTASGATASHTFASEGTYTVTLTVTDDDGAEHTTSQPVTVTDEPGPGPDPSEPLVQDDFERTVPVGWGSALAGGAWTVTGGSSAATSVAEGTGRMVLLPGDTRHATLNASNVTDGVFETQFALSPGAETGGSYMGVLARDSAAGRYLVRAWLRPDGTVWLVAHRDSTVLQVQPLANVTYSADTPYILKVSVNGSSPTTLTAKFWQAGTPEPPSWQLTTTDNAEPLQGAGSVGLSGARAASATATLSVAFESFTVTEFE